MAAGPHAEHRLPEGAALRTATIKELFRAGGALLEGHFVLKSGLHSAQYLEKFLVLQHPSLTAEIGRRLALALAYHDPEVVIGPTTGGVLLAHETARNLELLLGGSRRALFAEPIEDGGRGLRRGFTVDAGERIVLVDDILTTGASLLETLVAVRAARGEPLGAAVLVDRSSARVDLGIPLAALGRIEIPTYDAAACPGCRAREPLVKRGSSA